MYLENISHAYIKVIRQFKLIIRTQDQIFIEDAKEEDFIEDEKEEDFIEDANKEDNKDVDTAEIKRSWTKSFDEEKKVIKTSKSKNIVSSRKYQLALSNPFEINKKVWL